MVGPAASEASSSLPLWEADLPILREGVPSPHWAESAVISDSLEDEAPGPPPEPAPAPLEAARAEAERILAGARESAEGIAHEARRAAVADLAREQEAALGRALDALREEVEGQFEAAWQALEVEAARLCASLVEPIVRRKVADDDQIVVDTVREGLARMAGARRIEVRVSPDCLAQVAEARDGLVATLPSGVAFELTADGSVSAGGAVLQGTNGALDLRIEAQVQRVREAAEDMIGRDADAGDGQ
jgi:flagellar assembly protein FliH